MASAVTKFGATFVLDVLFGQRSAAPPSYFVALITQLPGEDTDGDSLTEPEVANGYARVEISNDAFTFDAANAGVSTTLSSVVFPTATESWPVVRGYALCDALVGGNVYLYGSFNVPRRIDAGDQARIPESLLNLAVASLTTAVVTTF